MDDKANIYKLHLCRICQDPDKLDLVPISDASNSEGGQTCWETLKNIFCNIIWVEDHLASLVCTECLKKIYDTAEFQKMCLESNLKREEFNSKYIELVNNKNKEEEFETPTEKVPERLETEPVNGIEEILLPSNEDPSIFKSELSDDDTTTDLLEEVPLVINLKSNNMVKRVPVISKRKRKLVKVKSIRSEPQAKRSRNQKYASAESGTKSKVTGKISEFLPVPNPRSYETICKVCLCIFQTSFQLRDHIASKHNQLIPRRYRCEVCHVGFTTTTEFKRHYTAVAHRDQVPFLCRKCGCRTIRAQLVKSPMQCHCPVKQTDIAAVQKRRTCNRGRQIVCMHCHSGFDTLRLAKEHVKTNHIALKPFKCFKCDGAFETKELLVKHTRSNHQFDCDVCPEPFRSLEALLKHKKSVHEASYSANSNSPPQPQGLHCFLCKRIFPTRTRLAKHIVSRACQQYGFCKVCGAIFHEHRINGHLVMFHKIKEEDCEAYFKRKVMTRPQQVQAVGIPMKCEQYRECYLCTRFIHITQFKSHLTRSHDIDVCAKDFEILKYVVNWQSRQHEVEHSYSLKL